MEQGCDETDFSAFAWLGRIGRDWEGLGCRELAPNANAPASNRIMRLEFGPVSGDHDSRETGQYSQASRRGRLRTDCGFPSMPC